MRTVFLLVSAAVGLGVAAPASAEDLIQIYDMAVQSDPVLAEAGENLNSTREIKPQARALLLPNFGVTADTEYRKDRTTRFGSTTGGAAAGERAELIATTRGG